MSKKIKGIQQIVERYSTYFFDLDGVFWKGDQRVQGSFQCLERLRSAKKHIYFITNSSVRNREEVQIKFAQFKAQVKVDEIYTSSYITSLYLKSYEPSLTKVVCIGSQSLANELGKIGLDVHRLEAESESSVEVLKGKMDAQRQALIVGFDNQFCYSKLCKASMYLQDGLKFYGTNPDKYTILGGYRMPGAGTIIETIRIASCVEPLIIGKPNPFILDHIISKEKLKREQCLMVGDNLQTDIQFGINGKIDTLCVLTGVTQQDEINSWRLKPNYFCDYL